MKEFFGKFGGIGISILIGLCLAVVVRQFVFFVAEIPSSSMEPTLNVGDKVITNRLAYLFSDVKRFDIVVFKQEGSDMVMVKRVMGLPGESIKCVNNGIYINDKKIDQDFLEESVWTDDFSEVSIPEGCYFMLGDNRPVSLDSRYWENPFVKRSEIWGKKTVKIKSGE